MNTSQPIYLPGLNGIRAIAAICVVISHCNIALPEFGIYNLSLFGFNKDQSPNGWWFGAQAVTMFFVLSGFLITYLLCVEYEKKKDVKIKNFYIRRLLRIWPAYFLYILLAIIGVYVFNDLLPSINILFYIFFLANIPYALNSTVLLMGHLWSISVEEQFYLFWPWFFKRNNKKKLKYLFIILIILQFLIRVILWLFFPGSFIAMLSSVSRFDCMMIGGLFAILFLEKSVITNIMNNKLVQYGNWILLAIIMFINLKFLNQLVTIYLVCLCVSIIIIGQISVVNRMINLEISLLEELGKLSYGIYIYHPLVIFLFSKTGIFEQITDPYVKFVSVFASILIATFVFSFISYNLYEKNFLKLKTKFMIVKSKSTR